MDTNVASIIGGILSVIATTVLGVIALWQNKRYKELSDEKDSKLEQLTLTPECRLLSASTVSSNIKNSNIQIAIPNSVFAGKDLNLSFVTLNLPMIDITVQRISYSYYDKSNSKKHDTFQHNQLLFNCPRFTTLENYSGFTMEAPEVIQAKEKMASSLDVGFRVLKLDDTNMKDVYYAPDDYDQGMLAGLESNIKDDRTDLDLLFGCLIDWGLPLSLPYKSEKIDGCTVHTYNDGDLIACFDANIPESVVKEIAQRRPPRAVFRDSGFASSPEKINVFEIFKLYMPEDANDISKRVRVI